MEFDFRPFAPPGRMRHLIEGTFFAEGRIPYPTDRILPNGLAVLIVNLSRPHHVGKRADWRANPRFDRAWIQGVQTSPIFNTPTGRTRVLGVLFRPAGLHALSGRPMAELADRALAAEAVLGDALAAIEAFARSGDVANDHDRLHALIDDACVHPVPAWCHRLCDQIAGSSGRLALAPAYAATGLSDRQVTARFRNFVGVGPKVLSRIHRLCGLLESLDPSRPVRWSALAHEWGYYDQAHFNRDFRHFAGLSPRGYLRGRLKTFPHLRQGESVVFAPETG